MSVKLTSRTVSGIIVTAAAPNRSMVTRREYMSEQFLAALARINQAVHSTLDTDTILRTLVKEGCAALRCDSAALTLRRDNHWVVRAVSNMPESMVGTQMNDDEERHALLAFQTGRLLEVSNGFNDPRCNVEHLRQYNIAAVLVVPLQVRGKPFGVLFLNFHSGPRRFSPAEVAFAEQVAATAASALEHARLVAELKDALQKAEEKANDLDRSNRIMVGRELRMIELKQEIDMLCQELGRPMRYASGVHRRMD
jgi:GAF domain-containing protein